MDNRVFFIASFLLLFALVHINAEVDDVEDGSGLNRQERGFLLKVNSSWFGAYKKFAATKLMKNTALLTSLLNSSSIPFKTKKIALLSSLTNATVNFIIPKVNSTGYKLFNKASKLSNSTLSFFDTSSTLINNLISAKLTLKNNTFLAKLQFVNASGLALQTALNAKANKTNSKLIYLLNSTYTDPWAFKLKKKNYSLFWADEFGEIYNLTNLQSQLLFAKLNKTYLKSDDDDIYEDTSYTYDVTNEVDTGDEYQSGDPYQVEYDIEYE